MGSNRSKVQNTTSTQIKDSFVLLETNYRVYAYTNSPLQIAILALFVQIKVQFPNLVVGLITRDSVRSALQKGITANQIVHYLNTHSHRQMNRGSVSPILLPQTVVDQINLWEIEMNRLKLTQSFLYKNFHSEKEFILAAKYAKDLNFLLWESTDPKNRRIIVSAEGHEIVKQYVKNLIAERQR
jgi:transcription initiation factor TFIIH subunit 4